MGNTEHAIGGAVGTLPLEEERLKQVRTAWAEVLGVDDVGSIPLDTNFMESGGNSLLLMMLWEQLH